MKKRAPKSLRRILSFSILWIHLAVLAIALATGFFVLLQISREQTLEEGHNSLEYLAYQMDNVTDNLTDIRTLLMQDKSIQDYLSTPRSDQAEDINLQRSVMNLLYQVVKSYNYIDSITLFQGGGSILSVGENNQIQGRQGDRRLLVEETAGFQNLTPASGVVWGGAYRETEMFPFRYQQKQSAKTVVSLLMPLVNIRSSNPMSVLSVNIPLDYFDFLYSKNADLGAAVILYDQQGVPLISVTQEDGAKAVTSQPSLPLDSTGAPIISDGIFQDTVIATMLPDVGWYLAEEILFSALIRDMLPLQFTVGCLFLISIAIAVLFSAMASRRLLNPFQEITEQMDSIGSGELGRRLPVMKYTELNGLASRFNDMMEQIQQLVAANQKSEEEKRQLEVESLQSQINPHFLYNSLTTIRWMASMARAENVCQALLALNNVLRPIFSQPGIFWSLETERMFVQNFIDIMDYRFGNKTICRYDIPEDLKETPVLRFILQPVVENSLTHGLHANAALGKPGEIYIHAEKDAQFLDIWVEDNGQGMGPEEADRLNRKLYEGAKSSTAKDGRVSIGLTNVNRRILLQYGKGSGLWIQSRTGEGTAVRIRIASWQSAD